VKTLKLSLITLFAVFTLIAVAVIPDRLCFDGGQKYTFYCGTSSADCREIKADGNAASVRLTLKNVCGESAEYENFDLDGFLEKVGGKILFTEELSDSVNYYCSANLPYSVNLNGTVVNLHICLKGNTAKVASPIIFGGY